MSLLACALTSTVKADFVFEIDMDLHQSGVQSVRQAASGETFDIGLLLTLNGSSALAAFAMAIQFDASELRVNSVDISGRPTGFAQDDSVSINNTTGVVEPISGLNWNSINDLQPGYSGYLARLNVTTLFPDDSLSHDLRPYFRSSLDGVLRSDNFAAPLGVTPGDGGVFFYGGRISGVTAVPEPTSLVLVTAVGVFGLVRSRRHLLRGLTKAIQK